MIVVKKRGTHKAKRMNKIVAYTTIFRADRRENSKGVLDAMDAVAGETGAPLAQIALAWRAAQPGVTAPIESATSVAQLDELMGSIDLALSDDQLARLTAAGA